MTVDLSDYVTVDERIALFYAKHPEGSLQGEWTYIEGIGITYKAYAYRTPDDPRPGIGHASEPVPGLTPYTKNSELANCETSAWGRAIVSLGIGAKKGISSQEEVRNRSGNDTPPTLEAPDRGPKFTGSSSEIPAAPKTPAAKNTAPDSEATAPRADGSPGAFSHAATDVTRRERVASAVEAMTTVEARAFFSSLTPPMSYQSPSVIRGRIGIGPVAKMEAALEASVPA